LRLSPTVTSGPYPTLLSCSILGNIAPAPFASVVVTAVDD
jgi:hypothetical protein